MSRLPPLPNLIAFDAAARLAGFVRAAEELQAHAFRDQPPYQDARGFAWPGPVQSGRRRIALTDAGARYHAQIRAGLALIEETTRALGRSAGGEARLLKISVAPAIGSASGWSPGSPNISRASAAPNSRFPYRPASSRFSTAVPRSGCATAGRPGKAFVAR